MYVIKRIEIQYFRSIYKVVINDFAELNMFSGKNDVGKSNVLKALNLFFNNRIDSETDFVFAENFNLSRLEEVRKDSIKGKQFIRIKVTFDTGDAFEKTLPRVFSITKKWYRNDYQPSEVKDDIEERMVAEGMVYNESRSKMSLTKFLNRIRYFYIPAIKDRTIFNEMIFCLRETLYNSKLAKDKDLEEALKSTSSKVARAAESLNTEFYKVSRIESSIVPPNNVSELYRTLKIMTATENGKVDIWDRGDGIKVRYIPSILNYIAQNTSKICIWGYEEPENSLEYNLALQMADDFVKYANKSQILITTHSAAFIGLNHDNIRLFRCYRKNGCTTVLEIHEAAQVEELKEELGYMFLMTEQNKEYKQKMKELEELKCESEMLKASLETLSKPVLMTEGKTDVDILTVAWNKLFDYECPFVIKSCNVYPEDEKVSAAGCRMLENTLSTWKYDAPNLLFGLFDNDAEGEKSFGLNGNFQVLTDSLKVHRNGKAYAILLPVPNGLEKFKQFANLCIEFYFSLECLQKRIDGVGLELEAQKIIEKVGDHVISESLPDLNTQLYLFKPKSNTKAYFSEKIVPTFEKEHFENFRGLFEMILNILSVKEEVSSLDECAVSNSNESQADTH